MEKETVDKLKDLSIATWETTSHIAKEALILGIGVSVIVAETGYKTAKTLGKKAAPHVNNGIKEVLQVSKKLSNSALASKRIRLGTISLIGSLLVTTLFLRHTPKPKMLANLNHLPAMDFVEKKRGVISQAMVFYDNDDDAQSTHRDLLSRFRFRSEHWDITQINEHLLLIKTKAYQGIPIEFYVNASGSGEAGVQSMLQYFEAHNIHPTGYHLRSHNYVSNTERFQHLLPKNYIALLMIGSCRGSDLLQTLREEHKESQIVYTSDTGDFVINNDIVTLFAEQLRTQQSITWSSIAEESQRYARERQDVDTFHKYHFPGMALDHTG